MRTGSGTARKRDSLLDNVEPSSGREEPGWNPWAAAPVNGSRMNDSQPGAEPDAAASSAPNSRNNGSGSPAPAGRRGDHAAHSQPPQGKRPERRKDGSSAAAASWPAADAAGRDGGASGVSQPGADAAGWGEAAPGEPGDWGWGTRDDAGADAAAGSSAWPAGACTGQAPHQCFRAVIGLYCAGRGCASTTSLLRCLTGSMLISPAGVGVVLVEPSYF